jgi:hypothetical protein
MQSPGSVEPPSPQLPDTLVALAHIGTRRNHSS